MVPVLLAAPELGVEDIPEGVSQQVEAQDHYEDGYTGEYAYPWPCFDVLLGG